MIWYLLACAYGSVASSPVCLPLQPMNDKAQCEFVAGHYRAVMGYSTMTRCIYTRRLP